MIQLGDYISIDEVIGKGAFGTVHQSIDEKKNKMAVKVIETKYCNFNEPVIMNSLSHPYLNRSIGTFCNKDYIFIFQDLAVCNLYKWRATNIVSRDQMIIWTYQIAKGLKFLHEQEFIHCDIKPNNILICNNGQVKLTDFGKTVRIQDKKRNTIGTQCYTAPECLIDQIITPAIDIFSLGCTLWHLYYGELLFPDQDQSEAHFNCLLDWQRDYCAETPSYYHYQIKYLPYSVNNKISRTSDIYHFLLPLLQWRSEKRPTAEELLNSSLIRDLNQDIYGLVNRTEEKCLCNMSHANLLTCIRNMELVKKCTIANNYKFVLL